MKLPQVRPGPAGTAESRRHAEEVQALLRSEVTRVRHQAEQWRNGLAALLTLITTVSVVKGRDSIAGLTGPFQVAVGAALLAGLVLAACGTYVGMRAAYGLPIRQALGSAKDLRDYQRRSATHSARDLRWAISLLFATLVAVVAAVGLTWYGPSAAEAPVEARTRTGQRHCGTLTELADDVLVISTDQTVRIAVRELESLSVVRSCGS